MFSCFALLVVSLTSFLHDFHVSSCDCADPPVFAPSRLVVRHGGPAAATCTVCLSDCLDSTFGLEKSLGEIESSGTTISWQVGNMTEWGTSLLCFYNFGDKQCCSQLPVTVYKPPDRVSLSVYNHTGPMFEGRQYILLCIVHNVAPAKSLAVTFYRGQTPLGRPQISNNIKTKPVTESFTQIINPSKEDDGAQYWCEAELQLGPEGPQRPPVVMSQNISPTVYYKPYLKVPHPHSIKITEGERLRLICPAVGNPSPSYTWTLPGNRSVGKSRIHTIDSVATGDEGQYTCSVSNRLGATKVTFTVAVQGLVLTTTRSPPSTATSTQTETKSAPSSSSGGGSLIHSCIMCFMLLFLVPL